MQAILISPEVRPNRLETKVKDKDYHVKFARYCVSSGMGHPYHQDFLLANAIFWNFYKGNQWIFQEDLDTFLMDESGNPRSRMKFNENIIKPLVKQWVGNAIKMQFNAKAINISPFAKSRRDDALAQMLFLTDVANNIGGKVGEGMRNDYGLGSSGQETQELFENYYVDCYAKATNNLLRWSKDRNRFDTSIRNITEYMAITGMGIHKGYCMNGEQEWEVTDPSNFFWDRGGKRKDLKDASFMGEWYYKTTPDLFERFHDLSKAERDAMENFTQRSTETYAPIYGFMQTTQDRLFACESYWKDVEEQTFGYVMDRFGDELLTQINVKDEDGSLAKDSYTDKDLIIPQTENYRAFLGEGKKKKTIYVDVLRYCIFTPREICGVQDSRMGGTDIVYEYGKVPYQDTNALDPSAVEFPYKVQTFIYHNGEVISPIQDAINPQRMLNRALSASDAIINNSRLSGTVIDENAVDPQGGAEEVERNISLGKTVYLDTSKMGIQNVVGTYNSNLGNNLAPINDYKQSVLATVQRTTGVNDAMTGSGGKAGDLVGVKEAQIERGTLVQEDFYAGIGDIMLDTYQAVASQGKRIYADSKRKLSLIVGDEESIELIITKDMAMEDSRVFIHRASPDEQQKTDAMAASLQLFQLGLLGDRQVAQVWGRGDLTEVAKLMREFSTEKTMTSRMQQKKLDQQMQSAQQQEQDAKMQQDEMLNIGLDQQERDRQEKLAAINLKEGWKSKHIAQQNQGKMLHTQEANRAKLTDTLINREYDLAMAKHEKKEEKKKEPVKKK